MQFVYHCPTFEQAYSPKGTTADTRWVFVDGTTAIGRREGLEKATQEWLRVLNEMLSNQTFCERVGMAWLTQVFAQRGGETT